jgi:hypothetical protein
MTVRIENDRLYLEGRCGAEEAETLLVALHEQPGLAIDASGLLRIHLAVLQVVLALKPRIDALPADPRIAQLIRADR